MDKWRLIHAYMKNSEVPALRCPDDDAHLYPIGVDWTGDPVLRCMSCKTRYLPGTDIWKQIEENLNERG